MTTNTMEVDQLGNVHGSSKESQSSYTGFQVSYLSNYNRCYCTVEVDMIFNN